MRKRNRWSATVATLTLMLGLGVVSSNNQVARAVTTISQLGLDINGVYASEQSGWAVAMSADGNRIIIFTHGTAPPGHEQGKRSTAMSQAMRSVIQLRYQQTATASPSEHALRTAMEMMLVVTYVSTH